MGSWVYLFDKIIGKILAVGRQLVMHQSRQELLQLEKQLFTRRIPVGIHLENRLFLLGHLLQDALGGGCQEGSRRDRDRLMSGRKHGPAVGTPFGDVERFPLPKPLDDLQVIDTTLRTLREAETWIGPFLQIPVLNAYQLSFPIIIRYL